MIFPFPQREILEIFPTFPLREKVEIFRDFP